MSDDDDDDDDDDDENEYSTRFEEGDSALIQNEGSDEGIGAFDEAEAEDNQEDEIDVSSTDGMTNPDRSGEVEVNVLEEAEGEGKDEIDVSSTDGMTNPDRSAEEDGKEQHHNNQGDEIDVSSTDGMTIPDHLDNEGESQSDILVGGGPAVVNAAYDVPSKKAVPIASDVLGMEDHDQSSSSEQKSNHGRRNSKVTTSSSSKRGAPTGAEITARTIASSSSWLQLYGDLQQHLASAYTGSQQTVQIPDTVVFHRMKAISWYHTGSVGHGVEKKPLPTQGNSSDGSIELASVFRYFMDASRGKTIVASMIAYTDNSTGLSSSSSSVPGNASSAATSAFGHLKVTHVTEEDLRNLLIYNNARDVIIPAFWILQGFVGPGKSGHVATIVSESLGSLQSFGTMQWKNKHLLRYTQSIYHTLFSEHTLWNIPSER